jgi:tetratricopeptide (TPR) repeat protein
MGWAIVFIGVLGFAALATGQEAKPAKSGMQAMAFMAGHWRTEETFKGSDGKEVDWSLDAWIKPILKGTYLQLDEKFIHPETKEEVENVALMTWDDHAKLFRVTFYSAGSPVGRVLEGGFENASTFVATQVNAPAGRPPMRIVYWLKSNDFYEEATQVQRDGKWVSISQGVCYRVVPNMPDQLDILWDYAKPAESEMRFRRFLKKSPAADHAEIKTQIARALGLQKKFEAAEKLLDEAAESAPEGSRAAVRMILERGRLLNSSGKRAESLPLFEKALQLAEASKQEALAVDAAHMIAIVSPPEKALEWNLKAIAMSERATEPRAKQWLASLYNNTGWTVFEKGEHSKALDYFQKAQKERQRLGQVQQEQVARWCVARCLRELKRFDEALAMQEALAEEVDGDGFIHEELAELYAQRKDMEKARSAAKRALELLEKDDWFMANEKVRVARLKELAG